MKKKILSIILALSMVLCMMPSVAVAETETDGSVAINETNFPDVNWRDFVANNFDRDGNGSLSASEIANVKYVHCERKGIKDLKGIEYFTDLEEFDCCYNELTTLDMSKNTKLGVLECESNHITDIDIENCTSLYGLECQFNELKSLDLSKNPALTYLRCDENQLKSLSVSGCSLLTELSCSKNKLTKLDVSENTKLERLECYSNKLTSLYLGANTKLKILYCHSNCLTSLNVRSNTGLTELLCAQNQLVSLNVENNVLLKRLVCFENNLTELSLWNNKELTDLQCGSNALTSLNARYATGLENLTCSANRLDSLNVSDNMALTYLNCSDNKLSALDVSKNTALETLKCNNNYITSLNTGSNTKLKTLYCDGNKLTSLDLSSNAALKDLSCNSNSQTVSLEIGSKGQYDLSNLPKFNASNMTNWTGGTVSGNILTFDEGSDTVTYEQGPISNLTSGEQYIKFTLKKYQLHEHEYGDYQPYIDGMHIAYCKYCEGTFIMHIMQSCSGGVATVDAQAICEVCGQSYGGYLPGSATISGTSVTEKQGKEVTIDLNLDANTGLTSMLVELDYNKDILEFVSAENGEIFDAESFEAPDATNDSKVLLWENGTLTQNIAKTGKLATLKFKIKDDAAIGETKIKLLCDSSKYEAIDIRGNAVTVTADAAAVNVVNFYYGDVDGNNNVDSSDVLHLRRYLAKWNGYTINEEAADLDLDEAVTLRDITILQRHIAGWSGYATLPVTEDTLPVAG